jgi:hypothetical protein
MRSTRPRICRILTLTAAVAVCLLCVSPVRSFADETKGAAKPATPPVVTCVRVDAPPVIDGALDDGCWQNAFHCEGFYRTDKDLPAAEPTEASICCDDQALYVAFRCYDSKPGTIKREQRKRGGRIWSDDCVEVDLDTYHQHKQGYWFAVNARGTQCEYMLGGNVPKIEWRGDWQAAAHVNDDGWCAEIAIPFKILRYPNGCHTWGLCLWRGLAREREWSTWPRMGESWNWEKCADLTGLALPPYRESTVLLPYALAESSSDTGNRLHLGFDVKRPLRSGLRLYGTYNPDFRDVEDVVESIDFTYTERYLPERRPFFIESWEGPRAVLYTRRIEAVRTGVAVRGRVGRQEPTLLYVNAPDQGNILAAEYDYSLGPVSEILAAVTSQQGGDSPDNTAAMMGLGLGRNTSTGTDSIEARYYRAHSDVEEDRGQIRQLALNSWRGQGRASFWGEFLEVSPGYDPPLAYVPETGIRRAAGGANMWERLETGPVRGWGWSASFDNTDSLTDDPGYYAVGVSADRDLRNNTSQWVSLHHGRRERFPDYGVSFGYGWNNADLYRSGNASLEIGRRLGGGSLFASVAQGFRLSEAFSLQASVEFLRMTSPIEPEREHQVIVTGAYDLSDERTISGRLVERAEGLNFYLTYRQAVRHGMDAFVIVGDPNSDTFTGRIAIKTVWALFP